MTDTPNHDDAVSLDSVLDELLADAAREVRAGVSAIPAGTDKPGEDEPAAAGTHDGPEAEADANAESSDLPEEPTTPAPESEPLEPESIEEALEGEIDGAIEAPTGESPQSAAEAGALGESLEASLDGLLKQAQELHDTVSEVAPAQFEDVAPPPTAVEPAVTEPAVAGADVTPEPSGAPASNGSDGSIQSLDAELAALTDDLLAGEIETPLAEPPAAAVVAPVAVAAATVHGAASAHAPTPDEAARASASVASGATVTSGASKPSGPSMAARLLPLIKRGAAAASEPARIALGLVSAPILGKRSLQQSIGWLAAYTAFLAMALWIYLIAFHTPQGPVATSVPSSLHGEGHGEHGGDHADHGAAGHDEAHASDGHGSDGHEPDAGHGGAKSASAGHDAPKSDGHGAKSDGHGAKAGAHGEAAHEYRVVNGYAVSKNAPAKAGAKDAGKDGHGAKKEAKSGGH